MKKILFWCLDQLEYYSSVYENGTSRALSIVIIILGAIIMSTLFGIFFMSRGFYEMAIYDVVAFLSFCHSFYLILFKRKYVKAQYLLIFAISLYVCWSSYFLGYDKDSFVLYFPILFALYAIMPLRKKELYLCSLIVGISFVINMYTRFFVEPKYVNELLGMEYVNMFMAIVSTLFIVYTVNLSDKIISAVKGKELKLLEKEANSDFLTGLYNKRFVQEQYFNNFDFENSYIIIGDIDFFKNINDIYGHAGGDYVLRKLAELMKLFFRSGDLLARWSGEEFLIIVKGISSISVMEKINLLRENIGKTKFVYEGKVFHITMTFGIKKVDEKVSLENNIKDADAALYFGKHNGRNRVVYFDGNDKFV